MRALIIGAAGLAAMLSGCAENAEQEAASEPVVIGDANPFDVLTPWDFGRPGNEQITAPLQYYVVKSGPEDGETPSPLDQVVMNYEGRLASTGEVFDSSYERGQPATFTVGQLIPGWIKALQMMKPGDEWMLYIPSGEGYGARGSGASIPPNSDLIFRMEMIEVIKARTADEEAWAANTPWPTGSERVNTTQSGAEYIVLKSGDETSEPADDNDFLQLHIEGRLVDAGMTIASTFQNGRSERIPANDQSFGPVWTDILKTMREGDHWLIRIPSELLPKDENGVPMMPTDDPLTLEVDVETIHRFDNPPTE